MAIKINGQDLVKRYINGQEILRVYKNGSQVRPDIVPPVLNDYLCFTANAANSTIKTTRGGTTPPNIEISTNGNTWSTYTFQRSPQEYLHIGATITLSNIGDKVYRRNTSTVTQEFDLGRFVMTGSISASGDAGYLLNINSTLSIPYDGLRGVFSGCTALTTAPNLPATTLGFNAYDSLFSGCTSMTTAPSLPATSVGWYAYKDMFNGCTSLVNVPRGDMMIAANKGSHEAFWGMFEGCTSLNTLPDLSGNPDADIDYSYERMFYGCTSIKLSTTQTGEYQTPYIIEGYNLDGESLDDMFTNTGGTFTGTPTVNTTYYTSNTVI